MLSTKLTLHYHFPKTDTVMSCQVPEILFVTHLHTSLSKHGHTFTVFQPQSRLQKFKWLTWELFAHCLNFSLESTDKKQEQKPNTKESRSCTKKWFYVLATRGPSCNIKTVLKPLLEKFCNDLFQQSSCINFIDVNILLLLLLIPYVRNNRLGQIFTVKTLKSSLWFLVLTWALFWSE